MLADGSAGAAPQLPQRRGGEVRRLRLSSPTRPSASSGTTRATGRSPSSPRRSTVSSGETWGAHPALRTTSRARTGSASPPTEGRLYVVESRGEPHRKILAYDATADGRSIENKEVLIDAGPDGTPDGMRCDVRRQPVVRLGHGERGARRRARVRPRRRPDRPHRAPRALRQRLLRVAARETGSSWPRASRSMRSTSTPGASPAAEIRGHGTEAARGGAGTAEASRGASPGYSTPPATSSRPGSGRGRPK